MSIHFDKRISISLIVKIIVLERSGGEFGDDIVHGNITTQLHLVNVFQLALVDLPGKRLCHLFVYAVTFVPGVGSTVALVYVVLSS